MTVADSSTQSGEQFSDDDTGESAFLSSFEDEPKKVPSDEAEDATEDAEETGDTTETTEDPETEEDPDDPDNQEVEIKVGDKVEKAKLKDLKRLFGQEASLTQKSQAASEQLKHAEAQTVRATTATKALLDRAQAAYAPYAALDMASWAQLATQMSPENYNQLRQDAAAAETNVKFLGGELDGLIRSQQEAIAVANKGAATAAIAELSNPETGIKGWGQPLYKELVDFATAQGLPEFQGVTSAKAVRLMHMAMQYAKTQDAAARAAVKVRKAVDKSARVLKTGAAPTSSANATLTKAMQTLRNTGDPDDAANAFLASF